MVRGKHIFILIMAFMVSLFASEAICRYMLRYPDYGIESFVYGISSNIKWQPQYRPYSRYLNNETKGYHVFSRNNYGFPGTDIDTNKNKILVFGSSFIEAAQLNPESIASSITQKKICEKTSEYTVINLGRKAHDLYDSWFRYNYYKTEFEPDTIILVLDQRNSFDRHKQPLQFDLPQNFGEKDERLKTKIGNVLLSNSSLLALMYRGGRGLFSTSIENNFMNTGNEDYEKKAESNELLISSVKKCLEQFSYKEDKLVVISIFNDPVINKEIDLFCDSLNIYHRYSDFIQIPENLIDGAGHFNEKGNYKLGSFIAEAFFSYKQTF